METLILSSSLKDRGSYQLYQQHLDVKQWSREFQILFDLIGNYYQRDGGVPAVDVALLKQQIEAAYPNQKHMDKFIAMVDEAALMDPPHGNIKETVLVAKRNGVAQALAVAIANGKQHTDLLEEYNDLLHTESLESAEDGIETYTFEHMHALMGDEAAGGDRIEIMPRALNDRLDGGMQPSDSMVIFARPEMGKTALILTIVCGVAIRGHRVVLFNNEERIQRLYLRAISCITGLTLREIRENPIKAQELALERGFANIVFKAMSPGSPRQIDAELEKYPDCKVFVVDQLRNLVIKSENKTTQLEEAQKALRNIGKARNMVSISVTQAGDSAGGKAILDMGDVDGSNTGIPGACDVMLGVGADKNQEMDGIRVLTLIKNKVSGLHDSFPVKINPFVSKYTSLPNQ